MNLSSLFLALTSAPGALMYQVLVLLSLVATMGILWSDWRQSRTDEPKARMWAVGSAAAARIAVVIFAFARPDLVVPLFLAVECLTIVLLGWGFATHLWRRRDRVALGVMIGAWVVVVVLSSVIWRAAEGADGVRVQIPLWYGATALAGVVTGVVMVWKPSRGALRYLPAVLFLLAGGSLLGFLGTAWASGAVRVVHLASYPLLFVALYDVALQEIDTYRSELRSLSHEALRQTQELLSLIEATRFIGDEVDPRQMLTDVVRSVATALRADAALILVAQEQPRAHLQVAARHQILDRKLRVPNEVALAEVPAVAEVLRTRRQAVVAMDGPAKHLGRLTSLLDVKGPGAILLQPLVHQDQTLGVLAVLRRGSGDAISDNHEQLAMTMGVHIAGALENSRLYRALQAKAADLAQLLSLRERELRRETAILESMAEGILVTDAYERFIVANRAAEQILGIDRETLLGRGIAETIGMPQLWAGLSPGLMSGEEGAFETAFTFRERRIRIHAAPVLEAGRSFGMVAVLQDVTREYLAEEAKRKFVASISHALRTPLTAIRGYTEVMTGGMAGELPPMLNQFLKSIRENAVRMTLLTNNIISIAELERGSLDLNYQKVDIAELVSTVRSQYTEQMEARNLALVVTSDEGLPSIEGDQNRVRAVLDNLLSNAVKYSEPGTCIYVDLGQLHATNGIPEFISISIRDEGIGVPLSEHARIWERFYRIELPQSTEPDGLGIGLTIAKALVEAHGGRIWVDSTLGEGSAFTVLFPVRRAMASAERLRAFGKGQSYATVCQPPAH